MRVVPYTTDIVSKSTSMKLPIGFRIRRMTRRAVHAIGYGLAYTIGIPLAVMSYMLMCGIPVEMVLVKLWWKTMETMYKIISNGKLTFGHLRYLQYIYERARNLGIVEEGYDVPSFMNSLHQFKQVASNVLSKRSRPSNFVLNQEQMVDAFVAWNLGKSSIYGIGFSNYLRRIVSTEFQCLAWDGKEPNWTNAIYAWSHYEHLPQLLEPLASELFEKKRRLLLRPLMRIRQRLLRARCVARRWANRRWDPSTGPGMLRLQIEYAAMNSDSTRE